MMFMNPYGLVWLFGLAAISGFLLGCADGPRIEPRAVRRPSRPAYLRLVSNNC